MKNQRKKGGIMTNIIKRKNGNETSPVPVFSGLIDQVFQNNLSRFFDDDGWGLDRMNRAFNIPVNIRETDKTYEIEMMAPGMKKENFKLNVNGETLTVSFEHKEENNEENDQKTWIRKEYSQQSFVRTFNLDDTVDANKIEARYEDGVLRLSIAKKEGAQKISRNIEIQ